MIPSQPEIWIVITVATMLLLCLAVWKRTDVEFALAKFGIKFKAKGNEQIKNPVKKIDMLNEAELANTAVEEIVGLDTTTSAVKTGQDTQTTMANKAIIKNSKIGRLVGEVEKSNR
jgi:hypothetical protein